MMRRMKKQDSILAVAGRNIKRLRKERGLPVEELAKKSHINPERFKGIEAGRRDFRVDELECIANVLEVCPRDLVDERT